MTADELIRKIGTAAPQSVYFLYGEERFYQNEILAALTRRLITADNREFNLEVFDAKATGAADWIGAAQTLSFMGGQKLVVVRNLHEAAPDKAAAQILLDYLGNPSPDTCLVITADKVDRKRKLDKALTGLKTAVNCAAPREGPLVSWVKERAAARGYNLSRDAAQLMVNRVGARPGLLAAELEKITTFAGEKKNIDEAMAGALVGCAKLESVFSLTDALKKKDAAGALRLLRNQMAHGEEPLKIFGAVAWQFRLIWEVKHHLKRGMPRPRIAETMGTRPFLVDKAAGAAAHFSRADLRRAFDSLFRADRELKTTGKSPERVLEFLILNLCSTRGGEAVNQSGKVGNLA
ncbi:MAG: DNA polymerase III subunit delta [Nitrospinales bacterium]